MFTILLKNKKLSAFSFFFVAVFIISFFSSSVFASWNGLLYNPGDTLNPECLPTDTDCDVSAPLTSANIDDTVYGVGWDADTTHAPSKNAIYDKIEAILVGGHNPVTIGTANGLSLSTQVLSLGLASSSATGALSSADWNIFNNKQNAISLTAGSISFSNGTSIIEDNSNFFWDDTNNRLGIGTSAPVSKLQINSSPTVSAHYGTVSLGGGAFDGTSPGYFGSVTVSNVNNAGNTYSSNPNGTSFAINESTGFTGDLINAQLAGSSKLKVAANGTVSVDILAINNSGNSSAPFYIYDPFNSTYPVTGSYPMYYDNTNKRFYLAKPQGVTGYNMRLYANDNTDAGGIMIWNKNTGSSAGAGIKWVNDVSQDLLQIYSCNSTCLYGANTVMINNYNTGAMRFTTIQNKPIQFGTNLYGNSNFFEINSSTTNRLLTKGIATTSGTWTAQFHNSTGTNNALMIRDDGNIGIGNAAPVSIFSVGATSQFQINSTGAIAQATGITSSGNITFSDFTTNGGLLYTNGSGIIMQSGAGTSNTILHGGTTPSYSAVSLTADVSGVLSIVNGGTNNSSEYTLGSIIYSDGTSLIQDNSKFFWDDTNNRLGIGTSLPSASIHTLSPATESNSIVIDTSSKDSSGSDSSLLFYEAGVELWHMRSIGSDNSFRLGTSVSDFVKITDVGNFGIGINSGLSVDSKLHVVSASEQFRIGYDNVNYWGMTVDDFGKLSMNGTTSGLGGGILISPAYGSNFDVNLGGMGDFIVNAGQLYIKTTSGNVGIGTTNPNSPLVVQRSTNPSSGFVSKISAITQFANEAVDIGFYESLGNANFPRVYFNASTASGIAINSGIINRLDGAEQFFFGMSNEGVYGGTLNTSSGRFMGYYDYVLGAWRYGFNSSGDLYVGPSNNSFGVRLGAAGQSSSFMGGNVGIGTTTPASKLDISTGTTTVNSAVNVVGSINDFFQFNIQNTNTGTQAQSGYSATANNGSLTTGFTWMGINNSNFNYPTAYNIGGANDVSFLGSGQDMYIANANNTKSIIFSTGIATTPFFSERMRITSTGDIGIGTSAPTAKLHILSGTTGTMGSIKLSDSTTSGSLGIIGSASQSLVGTNSADLGLIFHSTKALRIGASDSGAVAMSVLGTGNVGIGTTTPSGKLEIMNGTIRFVINPNTGLGSTAFGTVSNHPISFVTNNNVVGSFQTNGNLSIGSSSDLARLGVIGTVAGTKVSVFRGATSQTANLTEWQDSAGTILSSVTSAGYFQAGGTTGQNTLRLQSDKAAVIIKGSTDSATGPFIDFDANSTGTAGTTFYRFGNGTMSSATSGNNVIISSSPLISPAVGSGVFRMMDLNYTTNASGAQSGSVTGLRINRTNTGTAFTTDNIVDFQAGGVSLFNVLANGNVGIGTTTPGTKIEIGSSDLGNGVAGPVFTLGRNTNATNTGAGSINFLSKAGTAGYVWQDAAGNVRINTSAPSNANDTAGTVVGAQTSTRDTKQDIVDYTDYNASLQMVLDAPLHTFRYIREVNGYGTDSPLAKTRIGYIADEVNPAFMVGNVIDQVSVNGILMASIKEENIKIVDIDLRVKALEGLNLGSAGISSLMSDFFNRVVVQVSDTMASIRNLTVETLHIGSPTKRTGITIYDEATGDPFCIKVVNGSMQTVPGECGVVTPQIINLPVPVEPIIEQNSVLESTVDSNFVQSSDIISVQ